MGDSLKPQIAHASWPTHMPFEKLVGSKVMFYGVDAGCFCITLLGIPGRFAFEAIKNPNGKYRSMMDEVRPISGEGKTFANGWLARVTVERDEEFDGYKLVDLDGHHIWLRMGTDRSYYPRFIFHYTPKPPVEEPAAAHPAICREDLEQAARIEWDD